MKMTMSVLPRSRAKTTILDVQAKAKIISSRQLTGSTTQNNERRNVSTRTRPIGIIQALLVGMKTARSQRGE
jgi:hypothetical protein